MKKTIVIGIGGTGLSTIREIRRLIAERYEQGLEAAEVSATRFVYIDTHQEDINILKWSVLGKDISLTEGEKVIITGDLLKPMIDNPEDYPDISPWLPFIKNYVGDPGKGAKGIRPYGRLIYEYNENKREIRSKIVDLYNSLNQSFPQINEWRFYLVGGLSGGTGSGMFIPLSFDLESWNLYQRGTAFKKFYSFLVLPPLQINDRHNRYHANAYAALSEINYLAFQPERQLPFDSCYLLESQNEKGHEIGLDNLPLLIAQRIFLNIQGGEAASYCDGIMDNPQLGDLDNNSETGRRHSLRFSTFGLSVVSYPREMVAQSLAYKLAIEVVSNWLKEREYPQNINQQVEEERYSLRLSMYHIQGDADPFGINDYDDYKLEISKLVDKKLQDTAKKQLGANADQIREDIEIGFRGTTIQKFYNKRLSDVEGAVREGLIQTRLKITNLLSDSRFGMSYAKKYLDELVKNLTKDKTLVNQMSSADTINSKKALDRAISRVRNDEKKVFGFYGQQEFERDRSSIKSVLNAYLSDKASIDSGRYGSRFLDLVIPEIQQLKEELDVWERRISEVKDKLSGSIKTILDSIKKGTKENGKTIFNEPILDRLIKETNSVIIQVSVEEIIKDKLKEHNFDLINLHQITHTDPEEVIYESAYQWVLSKQCPIDIKRLTLYDKFVQEFEKPQQRQKILDNAKILSGPFLKFSPGELAKNQILSTEATVTTIPEATGRMRDGKATQTLIQSDLQAIGVPADKIKIAEDQERIIFLREKQVFPLRCILLLSELKKEYEQFSEKAALHIDKRIVPNLYDLYLLSSEERRNILEAEQVFIIARAFNWIKCDKNKHTNKEEISYEYEGRVGMQKLTLGFDWNKTYQEFVKDAILPIPQNSQLREARERLTQKTQQLCSKVKTESNLTDEIESKLRQYLQNQLKNYDAGIDDPRYSEEQNIINRIIKECLE
jgi:hypothetical protein